MPTDIEIANQAELYNINKISEMLGLSADDIEPYGKYKAKIAAETLEKVMKTPERGKLILVTAITPTPAGEGKSTVSIGLADALRKLGKNAVLSLREPSLGPCFGVKGGATGGGYSQIVPMDEINLNFTGDIHAVTAANNLLAAMIDNHIEHGNLLHIKKILLQRCVDLNDRALRKITVGLNSKKAGFPYETSFCISVASEVMAILCLAENLQDLKNRLGQIVVAEDEDGHLIYAKDLKAEGAMTAILKNAVLPNLVQTLEHTPAFVHGGPFANIAHGTSSLIAARTALRLADYVVTEAGFGADLGAEKFFDIFTPRLGTAPRAVVLVATIRALKMHGGIALKELNTENVAALQGGFANLQAHVENIRKFGVEPIIALNRFTNDTENEIKVFFELCQNLEIKAVITEGWAKGGEGCLALAEAVINQIKENEKTSVHTLYDASKSLKDKIKTLACEIYGAVDVDIPPHVLYELEKFTELGYGGLPICMAKTQNSISHDKKKLGAPKGYVFPITAVRLSAGAGFVVVLSGSINTMPGLPERPAAEGVDVINGEIVGLF